MQPDRKAPYKEDILKAVRVEIDLLHNSEKMLISQSDHILRLHEQAIAHANAAITKRCDILDKIDSLLDNFSVQEPKVTPILNSDLNPKPNPAPEEQIQVPILASRNDKVLLRMDSG